MSRLFFDTEFIEDGVTIDLVSLGVVRDDGATYYAEPREADLTKASDWVKVNVLPHLDRCRWQRADVGTPRPTSIKPRAQIAAELVDFAGPNPEWWAYFADYDWVALCQLYGRMIDLPTGWPMYCRDVKQLADEHGVDLRVVRQENEHHALADACWTKAAWELCEQWVACR